MFGVAQTFKLLKGSSFHDVIRCPPTSAQDSRSNSGKKLQQRHNPSNMAPWNSKKESSNSEEQDLTTLLTTDERADLTLLVANITEVMRKQLVETFDSSLQNPIKRKEPPKVPKDANEKANVDESKKQEETEEEKKDRKLREKREKELSAPKLLELKKDSLEFFHKWQMNIISRVGEAVNSKEKAEKQHKEEATAETTPDTAPPVAHKAIGEFIMADLFLLKNSELLIFSSIFMSG